MISTADSPGGMERVMLDLARQMRERGWSVRAMFPETENSPALMDWVRAQGVEAECHPAVLDAAAPHSRADLLKLASLVRSVKPDVVHIHYGSNFLSVQDALAVRLGGVSRLFVTLHQAVPWDTLEPRKKKMTGLGGKWLCRDSVAICEPGRKLLLEAGVPERKIETIYCGVRRPMEALTRAEARQRLGLPSGAFVIFVAASLTQRKGITNLICAVSKIPDASGSVRLVIAGDGPERDALVDQAQQQATGKVTFLGRISGDLSAYYAASDVFALPSYAEGVPLVIHEASMAAVPSIGTSVGGTPEAILDGETGLLVKPGDADALAAAIARLRDNPDESARMGKAAQRRAYAQFTDTAMADAYEELYRR